MHSGASCDIVVRLAAAPTPFGLDEAIVSGPMRRRLALLALAACTALAGCAHDGRSLAPENGGTKSIIKDTTTSIDDTVDEFTDDTLPGDDAVDSTDPGDNTDPVDDAEGDSGMTATLPFKEGEPIPAAFTCDGRNVAPAISWAGLPEGTVEIAIQVVDLEAEDYTQWVITGLKPSSGGIAEGVVPAGAVQAKNSKGTIGYAGPCPPKGSLHSYLYEVDAQDSHVSSTSGTDANTALQAIGAATIQSAGVSGTYKR